MTDDVHPERDRPLARTRDHTPSVAAVVVAGGRSTRMGRDKASLSLAGRSLLDRVLDTVAQLPAIEEVVLVIGPRQRPPQRIDDLPLTVVRDRVEGEGPFAAVAAGLAAARADICVVLGCDTPFVRPALLQLLVARARSHAIVVPVYEGRLQPLCSAVRREALPEIEALLAAGERAVSSLADDPRAMHLTPLDWVNADPTGVSFLGVNTPAELALAEEMARVDAGQQVPQR